MEKSYFQRAPLVANEQLVHLPLFHYFSMNPAWLDEVNKGIREKEIRDCFATKGTFKNKVFEEKRTNIFSSTWRIFDTPPDRLAMQKRTVFHPKRIECNMERIVFYLKRIEFNMKWIESNLKWIEFDPKRIVFHSKWIESDLKRIVFNPKWIECNLNRIEFNPKRINQ